MEEWKSLPWSDGKILVSNRGRVRSLLRDDRILKATEDKKGYLRIKITYKRDKYCIKVHRAVAELFIGNPQNLPQVNHIDGNKKNNDVNNLEWTNNYDNAQHAIKNNLWGNVLEASRKVNEARKVPIKSTDLKTGEVLYFESISDAERHFKTRHVSDVLNGKREKAAGQYFSRIER